MGIPSHSLQLNLPEGKILSALNANQDGDADLFIKLNRNHLCFDHSIGRWYRFNRIYWGEDKTNNAIAEVQKVISAYASLADKFGTIAMELVQNGDNDRADSYEKKRRKILSRIKAIQTLYRKKAILQLAVSGDDSLGISGEEWDKNPMVLPCRNGIIDLETGQLIPGKPEQYLRTACDTVYDPDAPAPKFFLNFLEEVFERDQDLISYIQRLFGYSLLGKVLDHVFVIFCGDGRNGKGTLLQAISHVLGPLAGPIKSSLLLDHGRSKPSSSPNPDILDLRGKRLVWGSETNSGAKFDPGIVKWLVGGDILVGRAVYGKFEIRFYPSHTMILLTNHKPEVPSGFYDFAFWKRIHLVPFKVAFVENPEGPFQRRIDKNLPEKLKAESEGILNWLVSGCLEYQNQGLIPPAAVKLATKEYKDQGDHISSFIHDECILESDAWVKASVLYQAYEAWCEESERRPESLKGFGKILKSRFKWKKSNGVHYGGIKLKNEWRYILE